MHELALHGEWGCKARLAAQLSGYRVVSQLVGCLKVQRSDPSQHIRNLSLGAQLPAMQIVSWQPAAWIVHA